MNQLSDIADMIDATGLATLGEDLFIYHAPAEIQNCVILFPSADPPRVDPETPKYYHGKFQVILRNLDYEAGMELCERISVAITTIEKQKGKIFIKYLRPMYQARVFRRSESGALEFSVTYDIKYIVKN